MSIDSLSNLLDIGIAFDLGAFQYGCDSLGQ